MIQIKDKVISPYELHYDGTQFQVGIPKTDKHGVESLTNVKYYTKLENALSYISKQLLVSKNAMSMLDLQEFIELQKEVNEMLVQRIHV